MSIKIFIVLILIAAYPYVIYTVIGYVLVCIKRLFSPNFNYDNSTEYKTITLLIAAYNEELFINEKIKNTKELDYPKDKFKVILSPMAQTIKLRNRLCTQGIHSYAFE